MISKNVILYCSCSLDYSLEHCGKCEDQKLSLTDGSLLTGPDKVIAPFNVFFAFLSYHILKNKHIYEITIWVL